jgi:hypothetical protein
VEEEEEVVAEDLSMVEEAVVDLAVVHQAEGLVVEEAECQEAAEEDGSLEEQLEEAEVVTVLTTTLTIRLLTSCRQICLGNK